MKFSIWAKLDQYKRDIDTENKILENTINAKAKTSYKHLIETYKINTWYCWNIKLVKNDDTKESKD